MNIIKVKINFEKGNCDVSGINLITGDFNSTKIEFEFDREDGTKVFEMKAPSGSVVYADEIENNELILVGKTDVTTTHENKTYVKYLDSSDNVYWYNEDDNELYNSSWTEVSSFDLSNYTKQTQDCSLFNEDGKYIFEVSLYDNDSKLTSASGKIRVKLEQVQIGDEVVTLYLPIFDTLMQQVNTAITETNNLNITATKTGGVATVTITNKDGTQSSVNIYDGSGGGTGDYSDLTNKPTINSVELSGNKTSSDLGLQPAGNYITEESDPVFLASPAGEITSSDISNWNSKADLADIPDTSDFITEDVDSLTNYTKTSDLTSDLIDDTSSTNKFVTSSDKSTWNAKYDKPVGGIPKTDLSSEVQTSLGKADTAIQDISGKQDVLIPGSNITITEENVISATDTTYNIATSEVAGLMSTADKSKLDSITVANLELNTNKTTSMSSSSTDTQYPSAKCVYDSQITQDTNINTLKNVINNIYDLENILPSTNIVSDEDITINDTMNKAPLDINLNGNLKQNTTTGKNLYNATMESTTFRGITRSADTQRLYFDGTISQTGSHDFPLSDKLFPAGTYTFNYEIESGTITGSNGLNLYLYSDPDYGKTIVGRLNPGVTTNSRTFTLTEASYLYIHTYAQVTDVKYEDLVVKYQITSGDSADYNFEPYTNGVSPNPNFSQNIDVVTGDNEIIVANIDKTQQISYSLSLGTLEMCKIGNSKDKFIKNNGNWYKRQYIGKYTFTGAETLNDNLTYATMELIGISQNPVKSNYFTNGTSQNQINAISDAINFYYGDMFGNTSDLSAFLLSKTPVLYYILDTPIDTQITNNALIEQLNAIKQAISYSNKTFITQENENLPFELEIKAIKELI